MQGTVELGLMFKIYVDLDIVAYIIIVYVILANYSKGVYISIITKFPNYQ